MRKFVQRTLLGAFIGGGIAILGAGVANAADTSGDDGLLSGTQALVSVEAPVTVGGNAVSVAGDSSSEDAASSTSPASAPAPDASTSGDGGVASGSEALVSVTVPVTVSGNGISAVGDSESTDSSTAAAPAPAAQAAAPETSGDDSVGGGTQAVADVAVPVTVSGNAISVLGDSESSDASTGTTPGNGASGTDAATSGDEGIVSGTQAQAPIAAPATVGGNAISVLGDSTSSDSEAATGTGTGAGAGEATTGGEGSVLGGTQVIAPVAAPVTVGGNAISVLGDSETSDSTTDVTPGAGTSTGGATTGGDEAVLGGTQAQAPIAAPVTVSGNAISALGDSETSDSTTDVTPGAGTSTGGATTGGDEAVLGGTQAQAPIAAPVTVGGNAISVLGDSETSDSTTDVTPGTGTSTGGATTGGDEAVLGGTQVVAPIAAPITVGGNAISAVGDSESTGTATEVDAGGSTGGISTGGNDGILGGTQLEVPVTLPVTVGQNAISVVGDSTTGGSTSVVDPTDPAVPTVPTDPTDPTVPTDPTAPSDPTDPTVPAAPAGPGATAGSTVSGSSSVIGSSAAVGVTAVITAADLASTGGERPGLVTLLGSMLLIAVGAAVLGLRRRIA
jgi:hypothetical protein